MNKKGIAQKSQLYLPNMLPPLPLVLPCRSNISPTYFSSSPPNEKTASMTVSSEPENHIGPPDGLLRAGRVSLGGDQLIEP